MGAWALRKSMQMRMGAPELETASVLLIQSEAAGDHIMEEAVGPSMAPRYLTQPEI